MKIHYAKINSLGGDEYFHPTDEESYWLINHLWSISVFQVEKLPHLELMAKAHGWEMVEGVGNVDWWAKYLGKPIKVRLSCPHCTTFQVSR